MINSINKTQILSLQQRQSLLRRSLNAVPYFNLLSYEIEAEAVRRKQYKDKIETDLDFYLTEIRNNFNELVDVTSSRWNLNIYLAESGQSVYGYNRGDALPSPFIATDGRRNTATLLYQDVQRESVCFHVPRGDEIITELVNLTTKGAPSNADVVFCGFNILPYPYLNTRETELINDSLNDDVIFQTFEITVNHDGQKIYSIENDSRPRLILGFGVVNATNDIADASASDISIIDSTRHIKLTNKQIPTELLMPRLGSTHDTSMYYLPIEHYFMPFGTLRFLINHTLASSDNEYTIVMLTRTV